MICYKDMTFCTFYEDCEYGDKCLRALTDEVKADAERWMKDAPICCFVDKPDCHSMLANNRHSEQT